MALLRCGRLILLLMFIFRIAEGTWAQPDHTAVPLPVSVPRISCVLANKYQAGQACLAPGPQYTAIPISKYQALFARIPKTWQLEPTSGSDGPWVSRVQASPIPSIKSSSLLISFLGMPANEYMERAKIVYDHRVPAWNLAIGIGGSCSASRARCTSNLRCVGPESQEQCHPQAQVGDACDFDYKLCRSELVCKKGKCVTHAQAFKGEYGDVCGGSSGVVCLPNLGCTDWVPGETGICKFFLGRGARCSKKKGRRCKNQLKCVKNTSTSKRKCWKQGVTQGNLCLQSVECKDKLVCRLKYEKKKCVNLTD